MKISKMIFFIMTHVYCCDRGIKLVRTGGYCVFHIIRVILYTRRDNDRLWSLFTIYSHDITIFCIFKIRYFKTTVLCICLLYQMTWKNHNLTDEAD